MAEQPAMDSATETQAESVAPMPRPLNVSEAATNLKLSFKNLRLSRSTIALDYYF